MVGKMLWLLLAACSLLVSTTGCTALKSSTEAIDPPPFEMEQHAQLPSAAKTVSRVTIVMEDVDGMRVPLSVPSTIAIKDHDAKALTARAKQTIAWMSKGGLPEHALPDGFQALLPKHVELKTANLNEKTGQLTADLNAEFLKVDRMNERGALEAVVWAMTDLPGVKSVNLMVNGQPVIAMPQGGTPVNHPMTRSDGMNLTMPTIADITESEWFQVNEEKQTGLGYRYHVPVMKLVTSNAEETSSDAGKSVEVSGGKDDASVVNEWNWE